MKKAQAEMVTGVFIVIAFIMFVFGFFFIKNISIRAGTYDLEFIFADVTGLERHDPITISGLKIGKVTQFELEGAVVHVTAQINPGVQLPKDSKVQIKNLGMVGEKIIDIEPGTQTEFLQEGDQVTGSVATDIMEITDTATGLIQQAEELIITMSAMLNNTFDSKTQQDIKSSLHQIQRVSAAIDRNTAHLEATMVSMDELSANLNQILTERKSKVETSIDNIYAVSTKLDGLTANMTNSLNSVKRLLAKIENEEGTVGKVIARDEIYNDFRHLTAELDTLVQDLKKHPQKYLNLGFIKVF